ncbi:MAG: BON domain-containing protein [Planctomycetia bacterium]|nr:BON domain-containing protein [Planctomycetia bacterium]
MKIKNWVGMVACVKTQLEVKGMRQLIYGMMIACAVTFLPLSAEASNQKMVESVAAMLESSDLADGCELGLKYQNRTVWLSGTVPSEARKMAIEACVFHVKGVDKVVNNLKIDLMAEGTKESVSEKFQDTDVQAAAFERSIVRREIRQESRRSAIPCGDQIISDKVISVDELTNMNSPALPTKAAPVTPAPAVANGYSTIISDTVVSAPVQPMRSVTEAQPVAQAYNMGSQGMPLPMNAQAYSTPRNGGAMMRYDQPHLPRHAWPSYASYPNTAAVQYPKRYCAKTWPFIGPFYPYPQVPDGWRKVTLEWHDGYWHVDFDDGSTRGPCGGLFRMNP